ncbi:MAG: helix-turn-helix transcriptional regulator [Planctomycetes bacterium]|nr:helix-turn-helix transcriptional regulator [Planctomycetota bacterium]
MIDADLIRKRLTELRTEKGWKPADLAEQLGVTGQTVRDWERPSHLRTDDKDGPLPNAQRVAQLVQLYKISPSYLLGLSDHRSGIEPNSWVVDQDVVDAIEDSAELGQRKRRVKEEQIAQPLPRRPVLLSSSEYAALQARLRALAKRRKE